MRSILASLLVLAASPAFAQSPDQPPPTPPAPEPPQPPQPPESPQPVQPAQPAHDAWGTQPTAPVGPASNPASPSEPSEDAPLQFKIGSAYITPIGFMDFTGVFRTKTNGSGIGTNFGGIPYNVVYGNKLSETRLSMQNSRFGFRVDAPVQGSHVIGYMEADFLGNNPGNVAVSSNSNTLRSRLYWVDVTKGQWELLAGQSWSLITPGRTGISPLPADIFYTQDIDVNYQAGLVWGRIPELRVVYHPSNAVAAALAIDSPEQYIGGSAGGGVITLPGALNALAGTQLNNGTTTLGTPNLAPDVIAKIAVDPIKAVHAEIGGVERQFKIWNPTDNMDYSATGLGGFFNFNVGIAPGLRLLSNNFWSSGGGRYIFGQAPDLIVNADGSLTTVQSGSTVSGLEFNHGPLLIYGYYGGIYIDQTQAAASAAAPCTVNGSCIGYGYEGSPSGQNKWIQEGTLGFTHTFWKDPKYGALSLMGQYSYLSRKPWSIQTNASSNAHDTMVFFNLRYTLPGTAPKL